MFQKSKGNESAESKRNIKKIIQRGDKVRDIQEFWTACTSEFSSQMFSEFLLLNSKEIPVILKKFFF